MQRYDKKVERHMRLFYDSLSEKDRRRYAAVEAEKLGHGGVEYVAQVMQCHPSTVRRGRAGFFNGTGLILGLWAIPELKINCLFCQY